MQGARRTWIRVVAGVLALGALWIVAPAAQGAEPLRGQWHLDEASGPFADSSGNGLNATRVGTPDSVPDGKFGAGVRLTAKAQTIDAGNQSLLQPPTVTLMAWVRSSSVPLHVQTIAAQGAAGSCSHASYALYTGGSADVVRCALLHRQRLGHVRHAAC